MPLAPYVCANCGYWQRFFERPSSCPVCLDVRHAPPEDGWDFLTAEEMDGRCRVGWAEIEGGVWRFAVEPALGIGPTGYVIESERGNVAFEACDWYSDAALDHVAALGGVGHASASHPHAYAALWRVAERFGPRVALQREDLAWVSTFGVSHPFDGELELAPGLTLHHVGGHFWGQCVLHDEGRGILFAGDALKLELPEGERYGDAHAISCHKAFVRGIPLTHAEVAGYREVFARLDFEKTFTTFEQGRNVGREEALRLFDHLLSTEPGMEPMPL